MHVLQGSMIQAQKVPTSVDVGCRRKRPPNVANNLNYIFWGASDLIIIIIVILFLL